MYICQSARKPPLHDAGLVVYSVVQCILVGFIEYKNCIFFTFRVRLIDN